MNLHNDYYKTFFVALSLSCVFGVFHYVSAAIPGTSSVNSSVATTNTATKKATSTQKTKSVKKPTKKSTTKQKQSTTAIANPAQNTFATNQGLLYNALQEQIALYEKKKTVEGFLRTSNQKKIESIKNSINAGAQYAANNPDNASSIEYLNGIFQKQIQFKQKMLDNSIAVDGIFQGAINTQKNILDAIPKVKTQKDLDEFLKTFYYYKSQLGEYDKYSKLEWEQNNKMDTEANAIANDLARSFQ